MRGIIEGEGPDRIPAIFRLDPWYQYHLRGGSLPEELRGMSLEEVQTHLGLDLSSRRGQVFQTRFRPGVDTVETSEGERVVTEWRTPAGALRMVRVYGPGDRQAGLSPTIVEYPIKTWADYGIYAEIVRHTEYLPDYEGYRDYERSVGDRGYPMVILGPNPFHDLFLRWVGYEKGFLDLYDRPDVFLSAAETAEDHLRREMWPIVADSPAGFVMHGVNFDTSVTPPNVFRRHFMPYLAEFCRMMHGRGKRVAFHADGDMSGLLELMVETGYDVADCFACEPMGRCAIERARTAWSDRITIWGGIPSFLLDERVTIEELEDHLARVYRAMAPGRRFVLGIADQALPSASWRNIRFVSDWAARHARFPIVL